MMGFFEIFVSLKEKKYKRKVERICDNLHIQGSLRNYYISLYYPTGINKKEEKNIQIVLKRVYVGERLELGLKGLERIKGIRI